MAPNWLAIAIVLGVGGLVWTAVRTRRASRRKFRGLPLASLIIGPSLAGALYAVEYFFGEGRIPSDIPAELPSILLMGLIAGALASLLFWALR